MFTSFFLKYCPKQVESTLSYALSTEYYLWIKPTDALKSNFIGITTLRVSGSLSAHHQAFLAVHRLWYILCSFDERSAILLLVANVHHNCIKCTKADVRLRTPDDRLPETCRVIISIKLEFNASVGFIHKESVTMYGHTIVKISRSVLTF
jgi:hypothetical protein